MRRAEAATGGGGKNKEQGPHTQHPSYARNPTVLDARPTPARLFYRQPRHPRPTGSARTYVLAKQTPTARATRITKPTRKTQPLDHDAAHLEILVLVERSRLQKHTHTELTTPTPAHGLIAATNARPHWVQDGRANDSGRAKNPSRMYPRTTALTDSGHSDSRRRGTPMHPSLCCMKSIITTTFTSTCSSGGKGEGIEQRETRDIHRARASRSNVLVALLLSSPISFFLPPRAHSARAVPGHRVPPRAQPPSPPPSPSSDDRHRRGLENLRRQGGVLLPQLLAQGKRVRLSRSSARLVVPNGLGSKGKLQSVPATQKRHPREHHTPANHGHRDAREGGEEVSFRNIGERASAA